MSYTPPPSDPSQKTFACVKWSYIGAHKKTHKLFKSQPVGKDRQRDVPFPQQDDYFLGNLLEMADISGERKKINQKEQREEWLAKYKKTRRGRYTKLGFGEAAIRSDFTRYLKKHKVCQDENEYPVWRAPVVKILSKCDLRLFGIRIILDEDSGVYTFSNVDYLMGLARKADFVVMGGFLLLKSRFQTMRVGELNFCEFENEKEFSSCFSQKSWLQQRDSTIIKLDLKVDERFFNMKISTCLISLPIQLKCQ